MDLNTKTTGIVTGIISNLVTVEVNGPVSQNEICYIYLGETKLMAEVIKEQVINQEKTTGKEIKKVEMFGKSGKSFYLCTPRNVII